MVRICDPDADAIARVAFIIISSVFLFPTRLPLMVRIRDPDADTVARVAFIITSSIFLFPARLPLMVRIRDPDADAIARVAFMPAPKPGRPVARTPSNRVAPPPPHARAPPRFNSAGGQQQQQQHAPALKPVCTLNLHLPDLDSTVNSEMGESQTFGDDARVFTHARRMAPTHVRMRFHVFTHSCTHTVSITYTGCQIFVRSLIHSPLPGCLPSSRPFRHPSPPLNSNLLSSSSFLLPPPPFSLYHLPPPPFPPPPQVTLLCRKRNTPSWCASLAL